MIKRWVSEQLLKASNLDFCPKIVALFEDANELLKKVKMELSVQEVNFVRQSIATRAIPYPKLLIKDQNILNKKVEFPTRLVIPATKLTVYFPKIGCLGIK